MAHLGSEAKNAIDVPLDDGAVGTMIVGAPTLTFDYTGIGTSRSVYAQIVDVNTGLVVGNIVTPIPVTLDGRTHSVDINMADIVYTYGNDVPDGADLELQIVGSATPYLNLTQFGFINVSNVDVSLPTPGPEPVWRRRPCRRSWCDETLITAGRHSGCHSAGVSGGRWSWSPGTAGNPRCRTAVPTPLFL